MPIGFNPISSSVIIAHGSCGITKSSIEQYREFFEELNSQLESVDSLLLFVRGGGDDASLFKEDTLGLSNIKLLEDYSVVELKYYNVMCIGGSISLDRSWKTKNGVNDDVFANEQPIFSQEKLDDCLKHDISCIVTSMLPSFVEPYYSNDTESPWFKKDENLIMDIKNGRAVMDKIYCKVSNNEAKPMVWCYSFGDNFRTSFINGIVFTSSAEEKTNGVNKTFNDFFDYFIQKKQMGGVKKIKHFENAVISDYLTSLANAPSTASVMINNDFTMHGPIDYGTYTVQVNNANSVHYYGG